MPKVNGDDTPAKLKPYKFHGLDLSYSNGDKEALATCPFCDHDGKFSITIESGEWRCLSCNEGTDKGRVTKGGNVYVFLRKLWEYGENATHDYQELASNRGVLFPETLVAWGVCRSIVTREWLVPGYNVEGSLCQLYRYVMVDGRMRLLATPTIGHQLHGMNLFDKKKDSVYVCEGPWDAIVLWEVLKHTKRGDDGELAKTANQAISLLSEANVLAVPGCSTFNEKAWPALFSGKHVYLMYDNDHEKTNPKTGNKTAPAAYEAMRRVAGILGATKKPPAQISYLHWGDLGFNPGLPTGYDVRDLLTNVH